jgi:hypothetical protein
MFDADALIEMFQNASSRQGAQLKKAVADTTLAALQGRELTLKNIRGVVRQVADAASTGLAKNTLAGVDPEALLDKAVGGLDEALLKAVEAQRTTLATLAAQGADLHDKHLGKALADLEKMEDGLFSALKKAASGAGAGTPMAAAWAPVLEKMQAGGTAAGAQAAAAAEQFEQMAAQMQATVRSTRAASMKAAQALAESYAAMASGVLLGMSEALQAGTAAAKKPPRR